MNEMGITISNHKHSMDMGAFGYAALRATISRLVPCQEFVDIYKELMDFNRAWRDSGFITLKEYFDDYDRRAEAICEANQLDEEIINFLYKPDTCTKSVSVKTCRHLWALIKDYDDNVLYGYVARKDCAKFKDFKEIVRTCVEDKRVMRFS